MIVTLSIPDAVYEKYMGYVGGKPLDTRVLLGETLKKFASLEPNARAVVLDEETRRRLEKAYGKPIEDPRAFADWLEKQLKVEIGGVAIPISETQRRRLEVDAQKLGVTPAEMMKAAISKLAIVALGGA